MRPASSPQDRRLDVDGRHARQIRQVGPLIGVGLQTVIHKDAAALLTSRLLQGQGDQVAEASLGHGVLVREQTVIRGELELARPRTRVADDGGAQASGIARGHAPVEENPGVRTVARTRNLQGHRHA